MFINVFQIFTSKDNDNGEDAKGKKKNQAKELLARYGGAYLATSISLSLVSFSVCYLLINSGVDVQGLLDKVCSAQNIISWEILLVHISHHRNQCLPECSHFGCPHKNSNFKGSWRAKAECGFFIFSRELKLGLD